MWRGCARISTRAARIPLGNGTSPSIAFSASIAIALDDPALRSGFHAVERNGARMWRWTDGDATIPEHLLPAGRQPFVLMFRGRHQPRSFVGVLDTMAKPTMRPLRRAAR